MWEKIVQWDHQLLLLLNQKGSEPWDSFWLAVTGITTWIPLFLLFAYLIFRKYQYQKPVKYLLNGLFLFVITMGLTQLVKIISDRPRPPFTLELGPQLRLLFTAHSQSFFSGHAANSFAITLYVYLLLRKQAPWTIVFFIWPVLFSYSRLYLGQHFPTDVLAGMLVGLVMGTGMYRWVSSGSFFWGSAHQA